MTTVVKCPTCETAVIWQPLSEFRPFCSERCKLIDLGEWASDSRVISEPIQGAVMSEADLDAMEASFAEQDNQFFKE
ncbi:MAG: endogenous inhibitor of DNA gyrase (YacG/DUF329 family) [Psychrosphaera sp.]|jgi:endogenous inhibitor of DNA gyrase (YacG/DUF329 family)|uniref:DNA gyrase inhibitor YacG n=1 Tax=Psychrosphaera aquimarina TaxID=2044854 RepID=A0ABU3R1W1_9GAMM|nr:MULTISPECIES: DNA gyrase inhibitor YacG [Psychrosphaera]MBU2919685.1 DNA gyrase inhibitor YacG [Psychrosphaera sp. F3M07]MDU0113420.1 DNA gyrase inhibitor YacG [Psychrosphaera aquimarina]